MLIVAWRCGKKGQIVTAQDVLNKGFIARSGICMTVGKDSEYTIRWEDGRVWAGKDTSNQE